MELSEFHTKKSLYRQEQGVIFVAGDLLSGLCSAGVFTNSFEHFWYAHDLCRVQTVDF